MKLIEDYLKFIQEMDGVSGSISSFAINPGFESPHGGRFEKPYGVMKSHVYNEDNVDFPGNEKYDEDQGDEFSRIQERDDDNLFPELDKLKTEGEEIGAAEYHRKRVMIDFDNVIYPYSENGRWNNGEIIYSGFKDVNGLVQKASISTNKFKDNGFEIGILTSRVSEGRKDEQEPKIAKFLNLNNIKFDFITAEKIPAMAYIDDRAIYFNDNWSDVFNNINNFVKEYNSRN